MKKLLLNLIFRTLEYWLNLKMRRFLHKSKEAVARVSDTKEITEETDTTMSAFAPTLATGIPNATMYLGMLPNQCATGSERVHPTPTIMDRTGTHAGSEDDQT